MTRVIYKQLTVGRSLEETWSLWTEASHMIKWLAPKVEVEPLLGGRYELFFVPGNLSYKNTAGCQILKFDPLKELSITWKAPNKFSSLMNEPYFKTSITVRLKRMSDTETCIKVFHDGFLEDASWDAAYDWHDLAWSGLLNQLVNTLDQPEWLLGYSQYPEYKQTVSCAG